MEEITAKQLEHKLNHNKSLFVIDIREQFELQFGKIPGAVHIPSQQLLSEMDQLDKDTEYILVCHSGGRSEMIGQFLEMYGYKTVNVVDGMVGWNGELEFNTD